LSAILGRLQRYRITPDVLPLVLAALLLAAASTAAAQDTRVLLDTDRGPLLLELDLTRAPITSANFLRYVDEGRYDGTLIQRVVPGFVIQGGGFRENLSPIPRFDNIASERNNGLTHTPGTIALALASNANGSPNFTSGNSEWFINIGTNSQLNGLYTVFGRLVYGFKTFTNIATSPIIPSTEQPVRIPLVRRAVRVAAGKMPILPVHTGSWYDPANPGRGFLLEVASAAGNEQGPLLLVTWYTFHEGRQIWLVGLAPFAWGAHRVEVPLQISTGGQFGAAFDPNQVSSNPEWGRLTVEFSRCDTETFEYTSAYGNGSVPVRSLTQPTDEFCTGQ
jgi:peptidyl-prolyl cis-trans isomerase A (cyclophilin A)